MLASGYVSPPSPVTRPPPVTRQQLQLVLRVLVQSGGTAFTTAALLLVLLLARADPGLRAAFLNGPEASLLLVTLVNWGCHPGEWGRRLGCSGRPDSWEGAVQPLVDALMGKSSSMSGYQYAASAALVLAQCYLEPAAPRHLEGQQQPALMLSEGPPFLLRTGIGEGT
jgi:hypothetical protein